MTKKQSKKDDKEIVVIEQEISPIVKKAEAMKVVDAKTMGQASLMLSELNVQKDRITEEKEKVTKPLMEALGAERKRWKPIENNLDEAIGYLRGSIGSYQTEEIKRVREEENKIASRVGEGKGKLKVETAVAKMEDVDRPEDKVVTDAGMVKFREDKVLKITNALDIPRKFLVINERALLDALKAGEVVSGAELDIKLVPVNYR